MSGDETIKFGGGDVHPRAVAALGDALELASRMQELQMQPALRYQMTETAQSEVMGQYSESYMLDRIESYLQETTEVWQES